MNTSPPSANGGMTREDLLSKVQGWSLGCDNALLNRMKNFSEDLVKSSEEITECCDSLLNDVDLLQFQVANVTNQFLLLSNTQFVENCVQEFDEYNLKEGKSLCDNSVPTKAEKEAALIEKMREAIRIGVGVHKEREAARTTAVEESLSASTDSRTSSVTLPHLIGSSKFFSSRYCGLASENRLIPGTSINRASSAASGSTNSEESDKVNGLQGFVDPVNTIYNTQSGGGKTGYGYSTEVTSEPPLPTPSIIAHHDYPKVLPTTSDLPSNLKAEHPSSTPSVTLPSNPALFPVPPRPPSSTSSTSSESLFEDKAVKFDSSIFDTPNGRPRSISPPDIRPAPVLDLSDSDDEIFKPTNTNAFDSFFGNQPQISPVIPRFEPPPELNNPPNTVNTHENRNPEIPNFQPAKPSSLAHIATSSPTQSQPQEFIPPSTSTHEPESRDQKSDFRTTKTQRYVPVLPTAANSEYFKTNLESVISNSINKQRGDIPKPKPVQEPPPKKISIFDSSDSDDDLFSNISSKSVKKNPLFSPAPPKVFTKSNKPDITSVDRKPLPKLDLTDDERDEDIFASMDFSSKYAKSSFVDDLNPLGNEKLRDKMDSPTLESPATHFSKKEIEPDWKETTPTMSEDDNPVIVRTALSDPAIETDLSPAVVFPTENDNTHLPEHPKAEHKNEEDQIKTNVLESKSNTESLFKIEAVNAQISTKQSSNQSGRSQYNEPTTISHSSDEDDIFTSSDVSVAKNVQNSPTLSARKDQYESPAAPTDPSPHQKFETQHKQNAKSIFESSDSDDDLFSSKFKTKSTPTLREISPQPNIPEVPAVDTRFPTLDKSELRPPPILDMSDSSSEDDLFKPVSKPKSTNKSDISSGSQFGEFPSPSYNFTIPPVEQVKTSTEKRNENYDAVKEVLGKEPEPQTVMPPPLNSKVDKQKSLFDSSDSDDDLFASTKAKPKLNVSVKAMVNKMPPIISPKARPPSKTSVAPPKTSSLFGDSDDESDLFVTRNNKSSTNLFGNSQSDITLTPDKEETANLSLPHSLKSNSSTEDNKTERGSVISKDKKFGDVSKNLENIFRAKNMKITTRLSSQDSEQGSVSFDEQISNENLLRCITKDRPKIQHLRRPPTTRKFIAEAPSYTDIPDSEELGEFV